MKVKYKTIIITFICVMFIIASTSFIFNIVINKYINNIEHEDINNDFNVVNSIMIEKHNNLKNTTLDWAHWDDTYNFMLGKNRENYTESNLHKDSLNQIGVSFICFYDIKGNLVNMLTQNIDSSKNQLLNLKILNYFTKANKEKNFILNLDGKLYIISSENITTTDEKAESNGTCVMGKEIDSQLITYANKISKDKIEVYGSNKFSDDATYKIDNNYVLSSKTIQDANGNKSIVYSITMTRSWYNLGKVYFGSYVFIFVIIVILTTVIFLYIYDKKILKKLNTVNKFLNEVTNTQNINMRLELNGKDEINNIANTVNKMLTELENITMDLTDLSYHDSMTGLKNRAYMEKCFERLRYNIDANYSIIIGDANGLKFVNDTYGHKEGDNLIIAIADILKEASSEDDILFRLGGDEFLILIENKAYSYALNLINKIKCICREISHLDFDVSIALGSANNNSASSLQNVMKMADEEMYKDKQGSRNTE